jgi:ATP-dependent helicase/nuclease subunit A
VRTIFAVGDFKQSIFSFQGADPRVFARMRDHFRERAGERWDDVPLDYSFRSTQAVLTAVDAVFAREGAREGVVMDGASIHHRAVREGEAGLVEIWPPAIPLEAEESETWSPPTRQGRSDSPRLRLARLLALRIARMIESGDLLESQGRPIEPGDIMILVRRRDALVEELVRELKQRHVPVAGVDRMLLVEQIAVMDLMALGRFLLMPEDDLNLATVLRSPLIGLDEDALFALAHRREGRLWEALRTRSGERPEFAAAEALLSGLLARADFAPPYELFAGILGPLGGRKRLVGRLGPEALDPIDEFMTLALQYEREHVPSLQGFLHWLDIGDIEVKRDLDHEARGQVRIMTVHGAKGLQAPIVFLPDTMQVPKHAVRLLWCEPDGDGPELPLWAPRVDLDETVAAAARQRQRAAELREQRRLLYVAMTRAADRLYVCGWRNQRNATGCWYELIQAGVKPVAQEFEFDCQAELGREGWAGPAWRVVTQQGTTQVAKAASVEGPAEALPEWAMRAPMPEREPPRPLAPSRGPAEDPPVRAPLGEDQGFAFHRGRLVHRLLELLPDLPPDRRPEAARRFLARPVHGLDMAQQAEFLTETMRVLEDPVFAPLFGPDSLAEVPLVGEVRGVDGRIQVLSGRLDRLRVTPTEVLVLDYKTNRPPPQREEDVSEAYLRQMAAYRAALIKIYPALPVRCALLWTDGPRLMPLSQGRLDRYLP